MKKILLIGWDGYIGFALLQRLLEKGYRNITLIDSFMRRDNVEHTMDSDSVLYIDEPQDRLDKLNKIYNTYLKQNTIDIAIETKRLKDVFKKNTDSSFDSIINLGHQGSGPYSQINQNTANETLQNNIIGTNNILWMIKEYCPDAHYITIGSTGEYSHTTDVPIEEGYFKLPGASEKSIYPRRTNSIYHGSKIANTYLIDSLSRMWEIKSTDVQQAVVFGSYTKEIEKNKLNTRLDIDSSFGTVINKFMTQAVLGYPLSIYGKGEHCRGFITLNDSIQALMIAIENDKKEDFNSDFSPRVWNQLSFWMSIEELADKIKSIAKYKFNFDVDIEYIENPRHEKTSKPKHYSYKTDLLKSYGYEQTKSLDEEIEYTMYKIINSLENSSPSKISWIKDKWSNNIKFKGTR